MARIKMNIKSAFILIVLVMLTLAACNDAPEEEPPKAVAVAVHDGYSATLAEGIQFVQKQNYPSFIKSVTGMSYYEPLGRWSEGKNVVFTFTENLPNTFVLELDFADTFQSNRGKEILVQVGNWKGQFVGKGDVSNNKILINTSVPSNTIEFIIPNPLSPIETGIGSDVRLLGLKFKRLSVLTN